MMVLMFGQSLMVTGATVIILPILMHCMKPLVTVSIETKQCTKNLTCDCMTHHGTRSVSKVSDLYYFTVFEIQRFKLNNSNNNKMKKNWENHR